MEGENFESTTSESTSVETSSYSEPSSEVTSEASESSYADTSSQGESISATSDEGTTFELYTDPTTGRTEFRARSAETKEEEGTPAEEESVAEEDYQEDNYDASEPQESYREEPQEMPKYTVDEFSYALANNIVDESRVPAEFQQHYADFKISQAKAAFNARMQHEAQQREQVAQQMQQQQSPEARIEANKNFYANLETEAKRLALEDLGMKPEDLEDIEYDENADQIKANIENAKNWHKQRLMNELQDRYQREQAYKQGQQQLYHEIGEFTKQAQANEPHFKEIDDMLATAWQEMPTKYGAVVQNALQALAAGTCTRQQAQVIQKYYEDTRKMFYAKRNGLSGKPVKRKPPAVEKAGNGQAAVKSGPDYAALRNADVKGKKAWLADFMKNIEL